MSYKAAVAGLNLGGGKAVIIGDPKRIKSEALLRAYGRFVESLGGRYITAEDIGTYIPDMDVVSLETRFVTGRSPANGGGGDPSINTAYGVLKGMQAVAEELWNEHDLAGRHVVVQGVGKVGNHLCHLLHEAGARLTVADVDVDNLARAVREFGADTVEPGKAHAVECDIFAPCAMGAVVNDDTLPELKCAAIAGSANNVLARDEHGYALRQLGILYAPDYVVNAGGLINVADELQGYSPSGPRPRSRACSAPSGHLPPRQGRGDPDQRGRRPHRQGPHARHLPPPPDPGPPRGQRLATTSPITQAGTSRAVRNALARSASAGEDDHHADAEVGGPGQLLVGDRAQAGQDPEDRRHLPGGAVDPGGQAGGQAAGEVAGEAAAGDVAEGVDLDPGGEQVDQVGGVDAGRGEQRLPDRDAELGQVLVVADPGPGQDLAGQAEAVGVQARGGEPEQHVAGGDPVGAEQPVALHHPDGEPGQVVGVGAIAPGCSAVSPPSRAQRASRQPSAPATMAATRSGSTRPTAR